MRVRIAMNVTTSGLRNTSPPYRSPNTHRCRHGRIESWSLRMTRSGQRERSPKGRSRSGRVLPGIDNDGAPPITSAPLRLYQSSANGSDSIRSRRQPCDSATTAASLRRALPTPVPMCSGSTNSVISSQRSPLKSTEANPAIWPSDTATRTISRSSRSASTLSSSRQASTKASSYPQKPFERIARSLRRGASSPVAARIESMAEVYEPNGCPPDAYVPIWAVDAVGCGM